VVSRKSRKAVVVFGPSRSLVVDPGGEPAVPVVDDGMCRVCSVQPFSARQLAREWRDRPVEKSGSRCAVSGPRAAGESKTDFGAALPPSGQGAQFGGYVPCPGLN
jgi:hypothetical protein